MDSLRISKVTSQFYLFDNLNKIKVYFTFYKYSLLLLFKIDKALVRFHFTIQSEYEQKFTPYTFIYIYDHHLTHLCIQYYCKDSER